MFPVKTYVSRRAELRAKTGGGLILLPGNQPSANNYPNNAYYFRQDSTFLYYFGLDRPSLAGVIDADTGEEVLFGDDFTVDDIIWTGPQPTLREEGARAGVADCRPLAALADYLAAAIRLGRRIHYLPPYRGETKLQLSALLGIAPALLHDYKSVDLMFAVAEMREVKSAEEVAQMEDAFHIGYAMHTTAMRMCRAGVVEREIAGAIEGVAKSMGLGVSFPSIVSQHGETLHNLNSEGVLADGRLLLVDAGGENRMNYCSDHTRTYPVSGRFTAQQREIYDIVLESLETALKLYRPGTSICQVNQEVVRIMITGLVRLGILKGEIDELIANNAHRPYFMHGLSHWLGLDVHDVGNYDTDRSRVLEPGMVLTVEPGLYIATDADVPAQYRGIGIRIEDDIVITEDGNENLTAGVVKKADEIEALMAAARQS